MNVDFGKTASDYGAYRAGFPNEFFRRAQLLSIGLAGQRILDVGTGTGALARSFAKQKCQVIGLDISPKLLQEAERLAKQENVSIEWREARAESTQMPDNSFDVVSAGQCWHWFSRDEAAREMLRVLKPEGSLLIAHFDWLSNPQNVVERSLQIARKHRDTPAPQVLNVGIRGTYCLWLEEIEAAGFVEIETFSFDVAVPYSRDGWRGRMRASAIGGGSMKPEQLQQFDQELKQELEAGPEQLFVPHRVFAIVAKKPGVNR